MDPQSALVGLGVGVVLVLGLFACGWTVRGRIAAQREAAFEAELEAVRDAYEALRARARRASRGARVDFVRAEEVSSAVVAAAGDDDALADGVLRAWGDDPGAGLPEPASEPNREADSGEGSIHEAG